MTPAYSEIAAAKARLSAAVALTDAAVFDVSGLLEIGQDLPADLQAAMISCLDLARQLLDKIRNSSLSEVRGIMRCLEAVNPPFADRKTDQTFSLASQAIVSLSDTLAADMQRLCLILLLLCEGSNNIAVIFNNQ